MSNILPSLVTVENRTPLADSRQIAKTLGIQHRSFFKMIMEYLPEIEKDFGQVRFEIAVKSGPQRGLLPKYALLTEDQTFAYLSYSQNTEKARYCKRMLVKAFSYARNVVYAVQHAPNADFTGMTERQVRLVGMAGEMSDVPRPSPDFSQLMSMFITEAEAMTPEDRIWPQSKPRAKQISRRKTTH